MKRLGVLILLALFLAACGGEEVTPSMRVIQAFHTFGLEATGARPMESDDYGDAPQVAVEGTRFFLPFLGGQQGGRIMSFATQAELEQVKSYYENLEADPPPWLLVKDNMLVQLHGDLVEMEVAEYEEALNSVEFGN